MYDNTELKILKQVYLKPGIHKRELSKKLKLGMPSIDYAIKKIKTLLKKQKSGNQINFFLDYSQESLTSFLNMIEYSRFNKLPSKIRLSIREFLKDLKNKPLISVIFGSYAKGDYLKNSDIDILLIYQKLENEKQIENTAKKISMRTNTNINPIYLDYSIFRDNFHNSTKNFFKNLKKNKIILTGFEWWRQLKDEET